MIESILRLYDYLRAHRWIGMLSFAVVTLLLIGSVLRLGYKEDIADFLPVDSNQHNALKVYQDISGANKIFAVFQYRDTTKADPEAMIESVDAFVEEVQNSDSAHVITNLTSQVDLDKMSEVTGFVYGNIPYFLTEKDYARMDSALSSPDYISKQLQQDKQMLMFPAGDILSDNIQRDPLNIFTPVVQKLQRADTGLRYELYDGYIFSPDMQKAIVMINSPYGASETENNTHLIKLLQNCSKKVVAHHKNIDVHIIGGPVIAVGNASQIKSDSILSVIIAVTLIMALLLFTLRSVRNILLIVLSIAWGWLFAMGGLALLHDNVSIIVIGISSVILGIAVNYSLHFIAHLSHTPKKKKALREIIMPLLVGNVTTVGAFLALVPLQSLALRDLGLFSSFLLIGTILFVLIYLPHVSKETKEVKHTFLNKLSDISLENKPIFVGIVIVLTIVFGYFSFQTKFDANMANINYMTEEQKADMAYFQRMMIANGEFQKIYAVATDSTIDGALDKNLRLQPILDKLVKNKDVHDYSSCSQFIVSIVEQKRRLALWQDFLMRNKEKLTTSLRSAMQTEGFAADSFDDYYALLNKSFQPQSASYFSPLTTSIFAGNLSVDSVGKQYNVVNVLSVKEQEIQKVKKALSDKDCFSFDIMSMNSAIANHLSDDFNYIGLACGFIVFFFLWLSFGNLELALLSFIPMAVSWLWILGIMALFGMQFNIVNIILATFIFGQGDDYTIFMTEGAMYEYAYRRKMLASYKQSIIISALIMFIGIGTLIVADHPALHSLAEVTIAGMFSVVLMAYIFPPLIFNFLVKSSGKYRQRPISILNLLVMGYCAFVFFIQLISVYVLGFILLELLPSSEKRRMWLRRYQQRLFLFDLKNIPHVRFLVEGVTEETFAAPSIIVSNHQSMLDSAVFMALSPKTILVSNGKVSSNPVIRKIYKWNGFITLENKDSINDEMIRNYIKQGYSLVIFPEGKRNDHSSICRFHKGAFLLAQRYQLDIQPFIIHGLNVVLPKNSIQVFKGSITIKAYKRIKSEGDISYSELTSKVYRFYKQEYAATTKKIETAAYFSHLVQDRYRYKGVDIYRSVRKNLKRNNNYAAWVDTHDEYPIVLVKNGGYGEFALLYALVHRSTKVLVYEEDEIKRALLTHCAKDIANNLCVVDSIEKEEIEDAKVFSL